MPKPQVSVVKRQREQARRERQQMKAEKRAQRKNDKAAGVVDGSSDVDPDIDFSGERAAE